MWPIGIVGHLKPGWEDVATIAARLSQFFAGLAEIDPLLGGWSRAGSRRHRSVVPLLVTIPPKQTELRLWVEENAVFGARDGCKAIFGYSIRALTPEQNPLRADFWLSFAPENWWFSHRIGTTIFSGAGSNFLLDNPRNRETLIALLRRVLLIIGTAWDCDWAGVMPGDYRQGKRSFETVPVKFQSGWMVYLAAAHAIHIAPPQDVAVEKLGDGAMLLTAATDGMFNGQNRNHMAAALRIQVALDPLNAENERPNG